VSPRIFTICLLFAVGLMVLPLQTSADFNLVPCGQTKLNDQDTRPETQPCEFKHLIILIVRLINYLISMAAIVAMYYILSVGFELTVALGDPEKIKKYKQGITHAVVGFAIVVLAFVFVNLLVNGLFGRPDAPRNWWSPACLYQFNITNCPLGAGSANTDTGTAAKQNSGGAGNRLGSNSPGETGNAGTNAAAENPDGPAPENLRISPASSTTAGLFDRLDERGKAVFEDNVLTLAFTGQNLEGATITSNAQDIAEGEGLVITAIRIVSDTEGDDKVEADISIAPTTKGGSIQFTLKNAYGKSATADFNIQITGTQYLTRQFPETLTRIIFLGHWGELMPNQEVLSIESEINSGLGAISAESYGNLEIKMYVVERSESGAIGDACGLPGAVGCAGDLGAILVAGFNDPAGYLRATILHEAAHLLHAYYLGIYKGIASAPGPNSFANDWVIAVGNLSACDYLPLLRNSSPATWKNGETEVPHCGFIEAYGASDLHDYREDIATMTESAIFKKNIFNNHEVATDPRYKQKLDLLKEYGFINVSPLGLTDMSEIAMMGISNLNGRSLP